MCTAQVIHSLHNDGRPRKSHVVLNKNAGSGSSGCISVRSCRSAAAAAFRECGASGSANHVQCKEPWPEAALPRHAGVVTFRLRGGLPRGVAVLGNRRLGLSGRTGAPFGKPELAAGGNCSELEKLQLDWPEATLPRCTGVMVVPSLRRPASRCRGTLRPPAYAQLHLHTRAKGSAQSVKPDVCRCAAFKKKSSSSAL